MKIRLNRRAFADMARKRQGQQMETEDGTLSMDFAVSD
jgi:hypothetical protein